MTPDQAVEQFLAVAVNCVIPNWGPAPTIGFHGGGRPKSAYPPAQGAPPAPVDPIDLLKPQGNP